MTSYLVVAGLLLVLAIFALRSPSRSLALCATFLAGGFIALRYQLGYDWLAYERLFEEVPTLWGQADGLLHYEFEAGDTTYSLDVETIFLWLAQTVKSLGGTVEALFALVSIFNIWVIHVVSRRMAPGSVPLVWLIYFCLAAIAIQMNVIRQALASSFVLLGLLNVGGGRVVVAAALMLFGAAFHISTVMFWPLLLIGIRRPSRTIAAIVLCVGVAALVLGVDLFQATVEQVASVMPGRLAEKLAYYENMKPAAISMGAALLILWHVAVLLVLYMHDPADRFVNVGLWLTLYMLGAHLFFSAYPTVWTRVLAVALPWQVAAIWRSEPFTAQDIWFRGTVVAGIGALGIVGLAYQLNRPEYEPFVPYHSLVQVWFGDEGDGRTRSEQAIIDSWYY